MAALKLISPVSTSSEAHALFQNAGSSPMMEQKLKAARIMKKLLQNIVDHPGVDKYRRLRTNNEKLQKDVWPCRGSWDIMLCAGFTVVDELFEGDGGGAGLCYFEDPSALSAELTWLDEFISTASSLVASSSSMDTNTTSHTIGISTEERKVRSVKARREREEQDKMRRTERLRWKENSEARDETRPRYSRSQEQPLFSSSTQSCPAECSSKARGRGEGRGEGGGRQQNVVPSCSLRIRFPSGKNWTCTFSDATAATLEGLFVAITSAEQNENAREVRDLDFSLLMNFPTHREFFRGTTVGMMRDTERAKRRASAAFASTRRNHLSTAGRRTGAPRASDECEGADGGLEKVVMEEGEEDAELIARPEDLERSPSLWELGLCPSSSLTVFPSADRGRVRSGAVEAALQRFRVHGDDGALDTLGCK